MILLWGKVFGIRCVLYVFLRVSVFIRCVVWYSIFFFVVLEFFSREVVRLGGSGGRGLAEGYFLFCFLVILRYCGFERGVYRFFWDV